MGTLCSCCGEECETHRADDGIGPYEYWGFRGVNHDYYEASNCCGEHVVEGLPLTNVTRVKRARKDLFSKDGRLQVHAGKRYWEHVVRSLFADGEFMFYIQRKELPDADHAPTAG